MSSRWQASEPGVNTKGPVSQAEAKGRPTIPGDLGHGVQERLLSKVVKRVGSGARLFASVSCLCCQVLVVCPRQSI